MSDLRIIRILLNSAGSKVLTIEYHGEELRNAVIKLNQRNIAVLPDRAALRRGFEVQLSKSEKIKLRSKGGQILITRGDQTTEVKEVIEVTEDPRRAFLGMLDLLGVLYLVFAALIFLLLPAAGSPGLPQTGDWVLRSRDSFALIPAGLGMLFILLGLAQARGYRPAQWIGASANLLVCALLIWQIASLDMGWFYYLLPFLLFCPLLLLIPRAKRR